MHFGNTHNRIIGANVIASFHKKNKFNSTFIKTQQNIKISKKSNLNNKSDLV